jgi:hypothetical protein
MSALQTYDLLESTVNEILLPTFSLVFCYARWRSVPMCALIGAVYVTLRTSFELNFVAVAFVSFFVSETLISQRMMRDASDSTRLYATMALTFCFIVFGIQTVSGGIEPYEAAIISMIIYFIQARYRTQDAQASKLELSESKRVIFVDDKKNSTGII